MLLASSAEHPEEEPPADDFVQLLAWTDRADLYLPRNLALPRSGEQGSDHDPGPRGIQPIDPPDAPAALDCVKKVLKHAADTLGIPPPRQHWFRYVRIPDGDMASGFVVHCVPVVWLLFRYTSPQALAVTTAHEVVHYWQDYLRGRCRDIEEHLAREAEAKRIARQLVPRGTYRTPRGKKHDAWLVPAERRYH